MRKALIDADALSFLVCSAVEDSFFQVQTSSGEPLADCPKISDARLFIDKQEDTDLEIKLIQIEKPFNVYQKTIKQAIANLLETTDSKEFRLFLEKPGSKNFRYAIAKEKPYKGQRRDNPLTARPLALDKVKNWLGSVPLNGRRAIVVDTIESDDALCIAQMNHIKAGIDSIICQNDKDILQCQGLHFRMHRDHQDFIEVSGYGTLALSDKRDKVTGTGSKFFFAQVLTGDSTDNYGGLANCGAVAAYKALEGTQTYQEGLEVVTELYRSKYEDDWQEKLLEQGRLAWMMKEPLKKDLSNLWTFERIYA